VAVGARPDRRTVKLSVLDLATAGAGVPATEALRSSVELAQHAERWGYVRYWFAEHHNMPAILSSSPAILAGYIAANTGRIRVGAGGVMLPNHSPLVIAEQYGTLETLYPGRVDLGLGRAPGTDAETLRALRTDPHAAERFPEDVVELQRLLADAQPGQRVRAVPGAGTNVPLYILGSSLFGARLAAVLGLPYAFASHFAPDDLLPAMASYRRDFQASGQLARPYAIAGLNVFAARTGAEAEALFATSLRSLARRLHERAPAGPAPDGEQLLRSPVGMHARHMLTCSAVGDPAAVRRQVLEFVDRTRADEVIVVMSTPDSDARLRSYEFLAGAVGEPQAA
jgi:luciferase family oxidoreductase group 1